MRAHKLESLRYRPYDAAGVASVSHSVKSDGVWKVIKQYLDATVALYDLLLSLQQFDDHPNRMKEKLVLKVTKELHTFNKLCTSNYKQDIGKFSKTIRSFRESVADPEQLQNLTTLSPFISFIRWVRDISSTAPKYYRLK